MAGNSMGGVIALWAALETPARVEKMALLGTPAYPENRPKLLWPLSWPLIGSLYEAALGEATVRWILKQTFVDPSVIDEDLVAEYSTPLASGAGRRAVAEFIRHAIPSDWQKRVAQYSLVKIPTLVLVGDHDRMVGVSGARRLAGDIPSSQLIVLDSCGHAPQEDAPGRVIAILKKFFGAEAPPLSR
jgi:pimeloyl-ACP methyl ester carboxylesterase